MLTFFQMLGSGLGCSKNTDSTEFYKIETDVNDGEIIILSSGAETDLIDGRIITTLSADDINDEKMRNRSFGALSNCNFARKFNRQPLLTENPLLNTSNHATLKSLSMSLVIHIPLIVFTNIFVIVTFCYVPSLRTPDNIILVGLAAVDISVGVLSLPTEILWIWANESVTSSRSLCVLFHTFKSLPYALSFHFLLVMTIDRGLAINYPFWYCAHMNNKKVLYLLLISFTYNAITKAIFFSPMVMKYHPEEVIPMCRCSMHYLTNSAYRSFLFNWKYFIELGLSLFLTIQVYYIAMKKSKSVKAGQIASVKLSSTLIFVYVIFWLPSIFLEVAKSNLTTSQFSVYIMVARHLRVVNCWMNAIVYALQRNIYRAGFKFLIRTLPWKWSNLTNYVRQVSAQDLLSYSYTTRSNKGVNQQNTLNRVTSPTKVSYESSYYERRKTRISFDLSDDIKATTELPAPGENGIPV